MPGSNPEILASSHDGFNSVRAAATRDKNSLYPARRQQRTPMLHQHTMKE